MDVAMLEDVADEQVGDVLLNVARDRLPEQHVVAGRAAGAVAAHADGDLLAVRELASVELQRDDALWWAFVTSTTVGYGDISPSTGAGRIVAVILMLMGIGLVSMLTGTIATYFTIQNEKTGRDKKLDTLDRLTAGMTEEELSEMIRHVRSIGRKKDRRQARREKAAARKKE